MVFEHKVKLNGVIYEAGENVPVDETETKVDSSATVVEEKELTKKELLKIAKELGLEVNEKMTNAKLKEMIAGAKEETNSGIKGDILTTPDNENEAVNTPLEGNDTEAGDNEDSSFLNDVINGNE
nr:MAG TPA: dimeris T4 recombination endonuclease VII [Caudoviricetes sp.]